jgi:hypothetical protein
MKQAEAGQNADKIKISSEAKRMQVVDRVSSEILFRLADPAAERAEVDEQIVSALSEEYGQPLHLSFDESKGSFKFQTLTADKIDITGTIEGDEADGLQQRLVEITKEYVNRTML